MLLQMEENLGESYHRSVHVDQNFSREKHCESCMVNYAKNFNLTHKFSSMVHVPHAHMHTHTQFFKFVKLMKFMII